MSEETIFDQIIAKKIPAEVVYEDEHVLAFKDIQPQAPIHVLVIPKAKVKDLAQLQSWGPEKVGHYLQGVACTAKELGLEPGGYRVVFNTGKDGQQTVAYLHAHILGGRQMKWPPG